MVQRLGRWGWKVKDARTLPCWHSWAGGEWCWEVRDRLPWFNFSAWLCCWTGGVRAMPWMQELSGFRWSTFHPPLSSWRRSCGVWLGHTLCAVWLSQECSCIPPSLWLCCSSRVSRGDAAAPSSAHWGWGLPAQQQPHLYPSSSGGTWPQLCPSTGSPRLTPSPVCFSIQICDNLTFLLTVSTENICVLWIS